MTVEFNSGTVVPQFLSGEPAPQGFIQTVVTTIKNLLSDATAPVYSMSITKEVNKIPHARLLIRDGDPATQDFDISNAENFAPGKEIIIQLRYEGGEKTFVKPVTVFKGIVVKQCIKHRANKPSVLEILCKDQSVKLTIGKTNQYFTRDDNLQASQGSTRPNDNTDSQIIREILSKRKIGIGVIENTTVSHREVVKYYSTDWDFIVARAEVNSKVVIADDGKVSIKTPKITGVDVLDTNILSYGDNVYEFTLEIDARNQFKKIKANTWSPNEDGIISADSDNLLQLNDNANDASDKLATVINLEDFLIQHTGKVADDELKSWANAKMLKSRLARVRGNIKVQGTNNIRPGDVVRLRGMGDRFNGLAYVSGITNEVYDGNWFTTVKVGLDFEWFSDHAEGLNDTPAAGMLPGVKGLQVGVVVRIENDPESEDRILVRIPIIDQNSDGIWARVLKLDAGADRGIIFRPEVNDQVIVGFLNDDPRDPVILGMVHTGNKARGQGNQIPEGFEATRDNSIKGIVTKGKMRITFDDSKPSVQISTPGDKIVTLDDKVGSITLTDEFDNLIEMGKDGIKIKSAKGKVEIEGSEDVTLNSTKKNVKVTARSEVSAKGQTATVEGTQTNIKGTSRVNIN